MTCSPIQLKIEHKVNERKDKKWKLATWATILLTAAPLWPADESEERKIALWALRKGGRVLLQGATEYVSDPVDLPASGAIRITGIDMHGTVVPPKELEPLSKLPDLREVMLPARVWSPTFDKKSEYADEMFDFLAHSTKS